MTPPAAIVGAQLVETVLSGSRADHGRAFLEGHEHRVNGEIAPGQARDRTELLLISAGFDVTLTTLPNTTGCGEVII